MQFKLAQIVGILITVGAVTAMQLKKKRHILALSGLVNLLSALNIFLLGQMGSGVILNCVAVVQVGFSIWHDWKGTQPSLAEKILFFIVYVACGILGFRQPLDIIPILSVVFYMTAVFQKKEQNLRLFMMGNGVCWTVYYAIFGSTAILGQIANIISALIGLVRYRKQT